MKNRTSIVVAVAVMVTGAYALWNSDWFQRSFRPVAYWTEEVSSLERLVEMDRGMLRDAIFEMKKLQATAKLDVQQEISSAKSLGLSIEDARTDAVEAIKAKAEELREDISIWREAIQRDEAALEEARRRLSEWD